MKLELPANCLFGNKSISIDFPDNWTLTIHSYKGEKSKSLSFEQIYQILSSAPPSTNITEQAKGCKTAVIIVDDISRPTPLEEISKAVIKQLEEAHVPRDGIRFVFAVGTHRAMNREEFVLKLGSEIVNEFRIYNHNPFFNNVRVGISSSGIPIELNLDCIQADYKIGIGSIFPHPNTGVSGGAKIIVPGIASIETVRQYHMQPIKRWGLNTIGRQITLEAEKMLGLNVKIDVLLNGMGEIAKLFIGNCKENIEHNYDRIVDFFSTVRPKPADLVVLNNYFKPTEPDVSICYPEIFSLINPGGQLIVSAHSPLGVMAHYMFGKWGENGIGGLAYTGDRNLPDFISKYFIFSQYPDIGMGSHYHFNTDDPRVLWARTWDDVLNNIDVEPKTVLVLPYSTVPFFTPAFTQ